MVIIGTEGSDIEWCSDCCCDCCDEISCSETDESFSDPSACDCDVIDDCTDSITSYEDETLECNSCDNEPYDC